MEKTQGWNTATVLVVGAGPAGLSAAIALKKARPDADVLVLDKSMGPGHHILSGAVVEPGPLEALMDLADPAWRQDERATAVLGRRVRSEDTVFLWGESSHFRITPLLRLARTLGMGVGHMLHEGDYVVSGSRLVSWLTDLARKVGVEVLHGFGVEEVVLDESGRATGVRTVPQGLDRDRKPMRNHQPGEVIHARHVILAEGTRGFVTERTIERLGLKRLQVPLYSVGVKQVFEMPPDRYKAFGEDRVLHTVGWPLWKPVVGPGLLGGGFFYPMGDNRLAAGLIMGLDWPYTDLVPQDAFVRFTEHPMVQKILEGGRLVEAGARLIPEGGYYALPRDPTTQSIGRSNVLLVGDGAGFVDMHRIKGLHNALLTGMAAGRALDRCWDRPDEGAQTYTTLVEEAGVLKEMRASRNFRQVIARFGNLVGFGLSPVAGALPRIEAESDQHTMTGGSYPHKLATPFDKDAFVGLARVEHREDQPVHCEVLDESVCRERCAGRFGHPCVGFCLAGVYEVHGRDMKAVNPSNCIHCKNCECKCPYDNLRWHVPEGGGGPRYEGM